LGVTRIISMEMLTKKLGQKKSTGNKKSVKFHSEDFCSTESLALDSKDREGREKEAVNTEATSNQNLSRFISIIIE